MKGNNSLANARVMAIDKANKNGVPYIIVRMKRNRWSVVKFTGNQRGQAPFVDFTEIVYPKIGG